MRSSVQGFVRAALQRGRVASEDKNTTLTTAARLRAEAAALTAKAKSLLERAAVLEDAAQRLEAVGTKSRGPREDSPRYGVSENAILSEGENPTTVDDMPTEGLSQGVLIARGKARDRLVRAAVKKGMTLGQAAEMVRKRLKLPRLPLSGLSQARRGTRPIRRDIAEAFHELLGFEATKANWPGGFKDPSTDDM